MIDMENPHLRLQQQIDCQLEVTPLLALQTWEKSGWKEEPGTDTDEAPLKYMALVLLDAIEDRAKRMSIDRENGVTVFSETVRSLPKAPSHIIARGLEIIREITGLEGAKGTGVLSLGIRGDSLELTIEKDGPRHIINFPYLGK